MQIAMRRFSLSAGAPHVIDKVSARQVGYPRKRPNCFRSRTLYQDRGGFESLTGSPQP